MKCVFDSSALLAHTRGEPGSSVVHALLYDKANTLLVHALNLTEVFYDERRAADEGTAQATLAALYAAGLQTREDLDPDFWQGAGRIKADYRRISLADCCGLALAQRVGGTFVTADKHELDRDEIRALCPIRFIR